MPPYLRFWGKARGARPGEPAWHPLPYHCLDVAASAEALLSAFPRQVEHLAKSLGTPRDNLASLLTALIALHDIGKFATGFQLKAPEYWPAGVLGPMPKSGDQLDGDHARFASRARRAFGLKRAFEPWLQGWESTGFDALWHAVAGHHGRPRTAEPATDLRFDLPAPARAAALAFRDDVLALLPGAAPLPELRPGDRGLAILSWFAAGLTIAADWLGSNRTWFPYIEAKVDVAAYWPEARRKAKEAVSRSGLLPAAANPSFSLADLLSGGATASPLQEMLANRALPDGPSLTIVEEVTGSGKTEAALLLAARLVSAGRASGLYFALPTMATADAMYRRMAPAYRKLFAADAAPSLVLAHGKRHLNDGFQETIRLAEAAPGRDRDTYPEEASAVCAGWLADDRRKAFLAHVGVGTIDQALLGVLPSKYQSLRLWGLADKVLILDEVHCYDAYVSRELERLLEFHAALGGSAILLSATLPTRQKDRLLAAFEGGLGIGKGRVAAGDPTAYPLVSVTAAVERSYTALPTRPDRHRELAVHRVASVDSAIEALIKAARKGGAVAWVRNAVDDAIEAAERMQAAAPDLAVLLLHSRFAMAHRLEKEEVVRTVLGRGEHDERKGFVLVGTQILEASLDYDVDLMVSDLAPVDLIIQRAGRIWRHADRRSRPLAAPELLVLAPDPAKVASPDWYAEISRRAPHVYAHHGIVWRSADVLLRDGVLATPAGVRSLVETVYGPDRYDLDDVPAALQPASNKAIGEDGAARTFANANLLELDIGYAGRQDIWTQDTLTPTRLGEAVTVFRLAKWCDGEIVPLCGGDASMKSWALSEISIASCRADGAVLPQGRAAAVARTKASWPEWEREMPILVLAETERGLLGASACKGATALRVTYSVATGLSVGT